MQSLKASARSSLAGSRQVVLAKSSRAFVRCKAVATVTPVDQMTLPDGRKVRFAATPPFLATPFDLLIVQVEVYDSKETASKAICSIFKQAYDEEIKAKGSITIAIPSGSVVVALGSLAGSPDIDFSKVHVFFCNERQGGKTFQGDLKDFMTPCKVSECRGSDRTIL